MIIEMSAVLCATDLQDELEVQDMDYESRTKIKYLLRSRSNI